MEMIVRAILSRPSRKMVLADIYNYILKTFPYYHTTKVFWRNAVRHNLSSCEFFVKSGRADNGRGYFWSIHPACVGAFLAGDFRRQNAQHLVQQRQRSQQLVKQQRQLSQQLVTQQRDSWLQQQESQVAGQVQYDPLHSQMLSSEFVSYFQNQSSYTHNHNQSSGSNIRYTQNHNQSAGSNINYTHNYNGSSSSSTQNQNQSSSCYIPNHQSSSSNNKGSYLQKYQRDQGNYYHTHNSYHQAQQWSTHHQGTPQFSMVPPGGYY